MYITMQPPSTSYIYIHPFHVHERRRTHSYIHLHFTYSTYIHTPYIFVYLTICMYCPGYVRISLVTTKTLCCICVRIQLQIYIFTIIHLYLPTHTQTHTHANIQREHSSVYGCVLATHSIHYTYIQGCMLFQISKKNHPHKVGKCSTRYHPCAINDT